MSGETERTLSRLLFRAGAAHPYLREPIERLERLPDPAIAGLATDGRRVYYGPNAAPVFADMGHLLMHCLFRHLIPPENALRPLWDLACDLSAEYLRTEFFPEKDARRTRMCIADALPEDTDPRVAPAVYKALMDRFDGELDDLRDTFSRDDHRYWYVPGPVRPAHEVPGDGGSRQWTQASLDSLWPAADQLSGGSAVTGRYGLSPGSRQEKLLLRQAGKYDFSKYLRRFSITREEMRLNLADFDYIPYYYGLVRYGSMPMIEPLEYAERRRVETLVIAIDTSGSCKRPTVERFLSEIEGMLMRRDDFFEHMKIHIMQCDAVVQSDVEIHAFEDWKRYTRDLAIKGRSGTDFRPVFRRVTELQARGGLRGLRGLLYFTDGDGAYPREKPPYETAFVFSTRKALARRLPEWIIPLCLERPDDEEL